MNRIKDLRQNKGWIQADLAQRLNTKQQTVARYESGERGLDVDTILRLCEIFGCSADYLLGRTPMMQTNLTPEEESLILAYRRADDRARDMVKLALEPFRQDGSSGKDRTATA